MPAQSDQLVLVVDDEPAIRRVVRRALELARYRVIEAEHGEEALAIIHSGDHAVAAVLSDVTMPIMGGIELAEHVHRTAPGLPVVLASGLQGRAEVTEQLGDRLHGYLEKPYSAASVVAIVKDALTTAKAGAA